MRSSLRKSKAYKSNLTGLEYGITNYMNKHNIYRGNIEMHQVIINSFYVEKGEDKEDSWKAKLTFIQKNFGLFAQYVQNNWKIKS